MFATNEKIEFSIEKARNAQIELAKHVILKDMLPPTICKITGVDVAYTKDMAIASAVLMDIDSLRMEEAQIAVQKTGFPYIPTLLSFREIPPSMMALKKLNAKFDVVLVDGHGYAHPYRCGFASHLGLALRKPTIGVAKSRLVDTISEQNKTQDVIWIKDKDEIIGAQIRTNPEAKPVYVSVGHMISLRTAIRIVKHCTIHSRIPEPIALAHEIATAEKRKPHSLQDVIPHTKKTKGPILTSPTHLQN